MNNTLKRILSACVAVLLLYLLVWPFINSAISKNYYIKTVTEGSPGRSYTSEFGEGYISVDIAYYNNVATGEETPRENQSFQNTIDEDIYNKLAKVANSFKGFHIFPRRHNGYAFYYDGLASINFFYTSEERESLLKFSQILEKIARGNEKYPEKRRSTYIDIGKEELNDFIKDLDLEE